MERGRFIHKGGEQPHFVERIKLQGFEAGTFLVDKPVGVTSFSIVQAVRRALDIKKVGHAGTLDPFATGLLIVCAGRPATRIIQQLMDGDKEYEATLKLGIATDSYDLDGNIVCQKPVTGVSRERVEQCLSQFVGEQLQVPPKFSALKHEGKPLYFYARRGIEVTKEPRRIIIKDLQCCEVGEDFVTIRVVCSKGTYIRTLADDIGKALGCGAHLTALRRLRSGPFTVETALDGAVLADRQRGREALLRQAMTVEEVLACVKKVDS